MEVILEKFTKYFRSVLHHNQRYFLSFCVIEVLNILLVYFNFWLTDWFLQYRFRYYGWQWVVYMMMSKAEKGRDRQSKTFIPPLISTVVDRRR